MNLISRAASWLVWSILLLACGLAIGVLAPWAAPGLVWPLVLATLGVAIGGHLCFEGLFCPFGVGLVIASVANLGAYTYLFFHG